MTAITIEIAENDEEAATQLASLQNAALAKPDYFEGGEAVIVAVIQVTTLTLPVLTLLIRERIRAKQHIKVKIKGIEVSGADLEDIGKFLAGLKKD